MNPWSEFTKAVVGKPMRVARREFDWVFSFQDQLAISVGTLWRVRDSGGIRLTSDDDGHKFGLPGPLDVEKEANDRLDGATVTSVVDAEVAPDFAILMSNGAIIDVIADSAGYESWETTFEGTSVIGRAGD